MATRRAYGRALRKNAVLPTLSPRGAVQSRVEGASSPAFANEASAHETEALLRRRPVPLDEAARAVEAYEAAVVALGAKRHG